MSCYALSVKILNRDAPKHYHNVGGCCILVVNAVLFSNFTLDEFCVSSTSIQYMYDLVGCIHGWLVTKARKGMRRKT